MPFDSAGFVASSTTPAWIARLKSYLPPQISPLDHLKPPLPPLTMPQQILQMAQAMIRQERHWIQHIYDNGDGRRCAVGALRVAGHTLNASKEDAKVAHQALLIVAQKRGYPNAEDMNDAGPHRIVVAAFDAAISLALAKR